MGVVCFDFLIEMRKESNWIDKFIHYIILTRLLCDKHSNKHTNVIYACTFNRF